MKRVYFVIPAPFCNGVNSSGNPDDVPAEAGDYIKAWIPVFTGMTSHKKEAK
jgi:hypothetical protein